jgi:hypothetical protein
MVHAEHADNRGAANHITQSSAPATIAAAKGGGASWVFMRCIEAMLARHDVFFCVLSRQLRHLL